jgi:mitotic spindle assembly checkpoint protein MAD1
VADVAADGDGKENKPMENGQGPGQGLTGSVVPRESYDTLSSENATLLQTLRDKEKRLLRLQQVFTAKSAEFREAIASILGLKLAFYPNGQVRVTSQFDLNASFVFQPAKGVKSAGGASQSQGGEGDGMTMQLIGLGEGGPQDIPQLMRYWVEQEQCIPGFIASVTLECYEKAKMEQGME